LAPFKLESMNSVYELFSFLKRWLF